jgi:hypothetical protein
MDHSGLEKYLVCSVRKVMTGGGFSFGRTVEVLYQGVLSDVLWSTIPTEYLSWYVRKSMNGTFSRPFPRTLQIQKERFLARKLNSLMNSYVD